MKTWLDYAHTAVGRPGTIRTSVERFLRSQMFQVVGAELRGERCRRLQTGPKGPVYSQVTGDDRKQDVRQNFHKGCLRRMVRTMQTEAVVAAAMCQEDSAAALLQFAPL